MMEASGIQEGNAGEQSCAERSNSPQLPAAFQSRIDAVFGSLGGSAQGGWSLNPSLVFKAGKDIPAAEADDVDDDASMEVAKSRSNPLMSGDVWAPDDEDEENGGPACDPAVSHQFRQTFEDEEEADEFDEVAVTSYSREDAGEDARRLRHLEVADDNVFERMCSSSRQLTGISAGSTSPMELEEAPAAAEAQPGHERKRSRDKRRVRFKLGDGDEAEDGLTAGAPSKASKLEDTKKSRNRSDTDVAEGSSPGVDHTDSRASSHQSAGTSEVGAAESHRPAKWNRHWQPQRGVQRGQGGGRGRGRGRGRRVPDHVVNPHKWTCYTLDEPLYVGQGAPRNSEREEQLAVASSDMATAYISAQPEESAPRFDPNQQTQIVFKRKGTSSAKDKEPSAAADGSKQEFRPEHSRLLASLHDGEEGSDDTAMHTVEQTASAAISFHRPSVAGKKRSLRSRTGVEDDNMDDT